MAAENTSDSGRGAWTLNHIHLALYLLFISFALTIGIAVVLFLFLTLNIPDISSLASYDPPATTVILDAKGKQVDAVFLENRFVVPLDKMPKDLPLAFVAAEDARFFEHAGVDAWSTFRALLHNLRTGARGQGGSTITQQVARSLLLSPEKTYSRKIKEAILAYRIDKFLSKQEILYIYLNQIYFGEGAYGVDAAARIYFGKKATELNLAEIAILAGLPQAPSRYSPFKHFDLTKKRQAYVLNRMADEGYITATMARKAYALPLLWGAPLEADDDSKYFVQYVRNYIQSQYGAKALTSGGLTIDTTLDQKLQKAATAAVGRGVAKWVVRGAKKPAGLPQAALIAMEAQTGKVLALVGGTDFNRSQFNRATQAKRQPGSAFKPIIYAAAIKETFTPASIFIDEPLFLPGATPGTVWQPQNYRDEYSGPTTLKSALIHSKNIVTVKILQQIGLEPVRRLAHDMGISSQLDKNLSLALGSSEVTLLELTGAYTTFANLGKRATPVFITKITDRNGKVLETWQENSVRVLDEPTAYQMTNIMQGVIEEGTGKKAGGLPQETAGKTGTTDKYHDAWFIGYTPEVVCGVWMGFDKKLSLGNNETGGQACAPIWLDFMKKTSQKKESFPVPEGIVFLPMDQENGKFDPDNWDRATWTAFRKDRMPLTENQEHPEELAAP
ncbi:MAG: PBP1A family penicillin-binding protein [Deltaproteobacteria bacterium]|nr:PBP1A family penicillin-binding protein [Deltaproteobacteria bacterium]